MAKGKRIHKRGTLSILAILLVISALIRVGENAGQAFANSSSDVEATDEALEQATAAPRAQSEDDMEAFLVILVERENELDAREEELRKRSAALDEAAAKIQSQLKELTEAEQALRETLALADQAAENDLARLTTVYENMKPKEAAELFETMEPSFAAGFLGRMKPTAAAGIMAGLSPEIAYSISVVLAGRNSEVPTE